MEETTLPYWPKYDWDGDGDVDDNDAIVYLSRYLRIRLTDPDKNPLPFAKCRIIGDPDAVVYECDKDGIAHIPADDWNQTGIDLEWEPADAATNGTANRYCWKKSFELGVTSQNDPECSNRLHNLGFHGAALNDQVKAYQGYFGKNVTGNINDIRDEMVAWHDGGTYPGQAMEGAVPAAEPVDETG